MTQNSSCKDIKVLKEFLIKYCYIDTCFNIDRQSIISMISSCNHEPLIEFIHSFFNSYIMPFYHVNRTKFNRLRSYFMHQVYLTLLSLHQQRLNTSDFFTYYPQWCNCCLMRACPDCSMVLGKLEEKLNSHYTQINLSNSCCS